MVTIILTLKFALFLSTEVFVIATTRAALASGTVQLVQDGVLLLGRVREGSTAALATVGRGR